MLPLYELVQDEAADAFTRHAAAEALVTLGLLRRERRGPSRVFLWLAGIVLALVAAAATSVGPAALAVSAAGLAVLVFYSVRTTRQERDSDTDTYIGPDAATIRIPAAG